MNIFNEHQHTKDHGNGPQRAAERRASEGGGHAFVESREFGIVGI